MKIPNEIRIGGIDYKVIEKDCITSGEKALEGEIDYGASEIRLSEKGNDHQFKCVVLWHEILHGLEEHANLDLGDNKEKIIDVFAYGVYQVLQDNGRKLLDIALTPCETCNPKVAPVCTEECQEACPETDKHKPVKVAKFEAFCKDCCHDLVSPSCGWCRVSDMGGKPSEFVPVHEEFVCDHKDPSGKPIFWNEGNKAFQCHKCGQVFVPKGCNSMSSVDLKEQSRKDLKTEVHAYENFINEVQLKLRDLGEAANNGEV